MTKMLARSRTAALVYLFLIVLAEVVDRDMGATTQPSPVEDIPTVPPPVEDIPTVPSPVEDIPTVPSPVEDTTQDTIIEDITTESTTTEVTTTQVFITTKTTNQNSLNSTTHPTPAHLPTTQFTTADMLSLIQERNSLQKEADSLRVAVIILGISTPLVVIAAIIIVVCLVLKQRRSDKMAGNAEMSIPTYNRKNGAAANRYKATETQFETDTRTMNKSEQNTFDEKPAVAKKPKVNVYANNEETRADNGNLNEPHYQPAEYNQNNAAESSEDYVISDDTESIYEEVQRNLNSSTAHKNNNSKTDSGQSEDASENNDSDGVYVNVKTSPEASGNYSGLDTTQEYTHFYN